MHRIVRACLRAGGVYDIFFDFFAADVGFGVYCQNFIREVIFTNGANFMAQARIRASGGFIYHPRGRQNVLPARVEGNIAD